MLSHFSFVWLCNPMDAACQASLSSTISWSLLILISIELVMHFNHLILCCLQSFSVSRSFPMSWLFTLGGHNTGASASASVLPMNIQGWFSSGLTGVIFLQSRGLSRVFSNTTVRKRSALFMVQLSHPYMTNGKTIALTRRTFVMPLLFNMLSRFVMTFLPRIKCLFILWLQSLSAVILEPKKIKSVTVPAWQADSLPLSHWGIK